MGGHELQQSMTVFLSENSGESGFRCPFGFRNKMADGMISFGCLGLHLLTLREWTEVQSRARFPSLF